MGFFSIFGKRDTPSPVALGSFSLLYNRRLRCWEQSGIEFWGIRAVDISIDATEAGPSSEQVAEYWRLMNAKEELLPRLLSALDCLAPEPAEFRLVGVHIPRLDGTEAGDLGRFWFDRTGDDHFMYGVESIDRWETLQAHRDD